MNTANGKFIIDYHGHTPAQILQFFRSFPKAIVRKGTHKALSFETGKSRLEVAYKKVTMGLWYMKFEHLFEEDTVVNFGVGPFSDYYELEFFFTEGNTAVQKDAGQEFSLDHKAVFSSCNLRRSWHISSGTVLRGYKLIFDHAFLMQQMRELDGIEPVRILTRIVPTTLACDERVILPDEMNLIREMDKGPTPELLHDIWIKGIALQLLYKFFLLQSRPADPPAPAAEELAASLKLMNESVDSAFPGIRRLSEACYLSASCFKRKFKERYSMTPEVYFRRLQMDKAETLLRVQGLTIREVAHFLGYVSQKDFSRAFRRFKGYLPSKAKKDFLHP